MNAIESTQHYKGRIEAELQNTLKENARSKEILEVKGLDNWLV